MSRIGMALLRYIWAKLQSPSSSLSNPSKFQTMLVTRPWLKRNPPPAQADYTPLHVPPSQNFTSYGQVYCAPLLYLLVLLVWLCPHCMVSAPRLIWTFPFIERYRMITLMEWITISLGSSERGFVIFLNIYVIIFKRKWYIHKVSLYSTHNWIKTRSYSDNWISHSSWISTDDDFK